ncbi:MAG: hypothetical protein NVSMB56_12160 [Pyrinomonadaceae bacterium]
MPEAVKFATKPHLARLMIARAVEAKVPFLWVTGDAVYGNDRRLRVWLEEQDIFHVMAVGVQQHVWVGFRQLRIKSIIESIPENAWHLLSCGAGSKGERVYEWTIVPLTSIMLEDRQRWLLVRRKVGFPQEMSFYVVFASTATTLEEIVKVAGARWAIEESFETAKGEVGLDQYEVRSWHGWYRHMTLSMLAHAYLTVVRAQATKRGCQKKMLLAQAANRRKQRGCKSRRKS